MPISDYLRNLRAHVGRELLLMPSAGGLLFDERGRVLLIRHSDGDHWLPPGGAVDPVEEPQDAVVREFWEETGLHVAPTRLRGVYGGEDLLVTYDNGDRVSYVMTLYECRLLGGRLRLDGDEALEARHVSLADFDVLPLAPWVRRVLAPLMTSDGEAPIPPVTWRPPA